MKPFNKSPTIRAAAALNTVAVADMLVSPARARTQKNRSPLRVRHAALASVTLLVLRVFAPMCHGQEVMSFFVTVAQWQYPDSTLATNKVGARGMMGDASIRTTAGDIAVSAVQAQAVWTTNDSMEDVIAYYETRLKRAAGSKDAKPDEGAVADSGTSVVSHDDSLGRPLAIDVILLNTL